jgi:peptide/nickel transport system substrate-binding protein
MQAIQAMVGEAGFDVTLKTMEFATLLSEQAAGHYQLSRTDWSGRVDPDGNIHAFMTCQGGMNDTKYCNPKLDELLNDARTSVDPAVRKARYDAAADILAEDQPMIYLGHEPWLWALSRKVTGFVPAADGMIRVQGLSKTN